MPLNYINLDQDTRDLMLKEIDDDAGASRTYISKRLTPSGASDWVGLLKDSARTGNDASLAEKVRTGGLLVAQEERNNKGKISMVKVPDTASETLADGEFNRF